MATVTTVTSSIPVEVSYECSICGTKNTTQTQLQVSARNENKASRQMQQILEELASDDLSIRYTHANLKCSCSKCHYSEPWAELDFFKLDTLIWASAIICGLIFLTQGMSPIMGYIAHPNWYALSSVIMMTLVSALPLLIPVGIFAFKKFQAKSSAKKIAALPAASLPVIRIRRNAAPSRDDIMARINDRMNNRS